MHYHLKVEQEKKTLERQVDFSTVAAFSVIDQQRHGYIDFESMRKFLSKFKKDLKKTDINSILRRIDQDADGKITFREFSAGITPEYPRVASNSENNKIDFNQVKRREIRR
jgi:Ca2+-binding EF-hand superfamily protein